MAEKKKSKESKIDTTFKDPIVVAIGMGMEVQDVITGVIGLVTAKSEFFNGCVRYLVEPPIKSDSSEAPKSMWFDVQQLVVTCEHTRARKLYLSLQIETAHIDDLDVRVTHGPGGDRPDPQLRGDHPNRREIA